MIDGYDVVDQALQYLQWLVLSIQYSLTAYYFSIPFSPPVSEIYHISTRIR